MPSLSYSELVGLLIAGALVLYPLTQTEPGSGAPAAAAASSSSHTTAQFVCPRSAAL